ncbi:MAG: hypothetical protein RL754_81 [Bacteroidota bacterium]
MSVSKMYNDIVASEGLTMSIGQVLVNLDIKDGTPSTALGPKMGMESTSLSRLLKNMEEQGLIYREKHPLDKRSVLIKLTNKGLEKRNVSRAAVLEFNNVLLNVLSTEQQCDFFKILEQINTVSEKLRFGSIEP